MSLLEHRSWCANRAAADGGEHMCASATLRIEVPRVAVTADQIEDAAFSLVRDPDFGDQLAVMVNGASDGFTLDPSGIRAFAMALLAMDSHLTGDADLAGYYRGEALPGTAAA